MHSLLMLMGYCLEFELLDLLCRPLCFQCHSNSYALHMSRRIVPAYGLYKLGVFVRGFKI